MICWNENHKTTWGSVWSLNLAVGFAHSLATKLKWKQATVSKVCKFFPQSYTEWRFNFAICSTAENPESFVLWSNCQRISRNKSLIIVVQIIKKYFYCQRRISSGYSRFDSFTKYSEMETRLKFLIRQLQSLKCKRPLKRNK